MPFSLKRIGSDLLVEMIAVFIGISIALMLDDHKEKIDQDKRIQNYFGLLKSELAKDTSFISNSTDWMSRQIQQVDSFLNDPTQQNVHNLMALEEEFLIQSREYLFSVIQTSGSFNEIYDRSVFNNLNNTITDSELFFEIQRSIEQPQREFLENYIYPNKNYKSGELTYDVRFKGDLFLNQLSNLNERLKSRYLALLSLKKSYENLLLVIKQ